MSPLRAPWLVAAWPEGGPVGVDAVRHLALALGATPLRQLDARGFVEPRGARAWRGLLVDPGGSSLLAWRDPDERRDLLLLAAEEAPTRRLWGYCERIAALAREFGAERVVALGGRPASGEPSERPAVHGAATSPALLGELEDAGVLAYDGRVPGLAGLLPAAVARRGLGACCLLVDLPFFAAEARNPAAMLALLERLGALSGHRFALASLREEAQEGTDRLRGLQERLARSMAVQISLRLEEDRSEASPDEDAPWLAPGDDEPVDPFPAAVEEETEPEPADDAFSEVEGELEGLLPAADVPPPALDDDPGPPCDPALRARIEALFRAARADRRRAYELKALLDEHGLFRAHEDRFLDLFSREAAARDLSAPADAAGHDADEEDEERTDP